MTRKKKFRKWILVISILGGVALSPFVALFLVYGYLVLLSGKIHRAEIETVRTSDGFKLVFYQKLQPHADIDVLFIHGTPGDANAFYKQFANPFPHANLLAVDRPGFGRSEGELERPSLAHQARALGALLEGPLRRPRILVGHSYGAPVAVQAALNYPEKVSALLLIGASLDPALEKVLAVQNFGNIGLVSLFLPAPIRTANRELLSLKSDLEHLGDRLGALNIPIVLLHGVQDTLVPVENVQYLEKKLAQAGRKHWLTKRIYRDFNHFIPWEQPSAVAQCLWYLRDHLEPVRGSGF